MFISTYHYFDDEQQYDTVVVNTIVLWIWLTLTRHTTAVVWRS